MVFEMCEKRDTWISSGKQKVYRICTKRKGHHGKHWGIVRVSGK